jgi:hypothetical protein
MTATLIVICLLLIALLAAIAHKLRLARRADYIRTCSFPKGLYDRLIKRHPELTQNDCHLVSRALRQFFLAHLHSGRKFVSMPSQVADDLWHEFILYTKHYDQFCRRAFGRFMHHTPAVVLSADRQDNTGLRRCWWYTCCEENINPRQPVRLPLLFALDAKLNIIDGFRYVADCTSVRRLNDKADNAGSTVYCGGDFGSTDFDSSTDGFGDAATADGSDAGDSGCGGGCSGGD